MTVDLDTILGQFGHLSHVRNATGQIVWRRGTGDNVELLHIRAAEPRRGYGTALLAAMIRELKTDPPYATVFGFTRTCNEAARAFYHRHGFSLSQVTGVYADGTAVLFSQPFAALLGRFDG